MLGTALNAKAEQLCVGTCACTGQRLYKFSFVLSVDVLQHAAFLSFFFFFLLFDYCARNMSAELSGELWSTLKKSPFSDLHAWLVLPSGFSYGPPLLFPC